LPKAGLSNPSSLGRLKTPVEEKSGPAALPAEKDGAVISPAGSKTAGLKQKHYSQTPLTLLLAEREIKAATIKKPPKLNRAAF
jgi:hypothetical protein